MLPSKLPRLYQRLVGQGLNHVTLPAEYTSNGVGTRAEWISRIFLMAGILGRCAIAHFGKLRLVALI